MTTGLKKILFILHMPPPVHGAAMVGKYIHDSELINSQYECRYINLATATSLEDIGKVGMKKMLVFCRLLRKIRQTVKTLHPDLVYVTANAKGGAFYKDYVIVMMLKRMGCQVVVHYHNKGVSARQDRWLDHRLYRRFFKDLKIILLSERLYPDIQKYVKRENVYICANGIAQNHGLREVRGIPNNAPRILFLSNLLIEKGVLVLLDALKIIKDKGCLFVCDIVGGETAEIGAVHLEEEIRQRGLQGQVSYQGQRYGTDKEAFLQDADLFVFPTFYQNECFPLVLLEAMQHSLSIVTTDEGGIADIVKDGGNGLICEKNDPVDLAKYLERLLNNQSLRIMMGQEGYRRYKALFTLEAFESKLTEIFFNL